MPNVWDHFYEVKIYFLITVFLSNSTFAFSESINNSESCSYKINNFIDIFKYEFEAPLKEIDVSFVPFWKRTAKVYSIDRKNSKKTNFIEPIFNCEYADVLETVESHPLSPVQVDRWENSTKIIFWYRMKDGPKVAQIVFDQSKKAITHVMLGQPKREIINE